MSSLSLARLRTFSEVAETCSFSAAALRVCRSQPALSRQMSELEQCLGLELFERRGRAVALTPAGKELLLHARDVLASAKGLEDRARLLVQGAPSQLSVGAHPGLFESTIPDLVSRYGLLHSDIRMDLCEGSADQLAQRVESRELDLAFARYMVSDSLSARRLFPMYLVAVMANDHRLARHTTVTVEDLHQEELLLLADSGSRNLFNQFSHAEGRRQKRAKVEISSPRGLIKLAAARQGVGLLFSMSCSTDASTHIAPVLHEGNHVGMWSAVLWYRHRKLPEHVQQLIDLAEIQLHTRFPGGEFGFPPLPETYPDTAPQLTSTTTQPRN